jgi:hypothetical protein
MLVRLGTYPDISQKSLYCICNVAKECTANILYSFLAKTKKIMSLDQILCEVGLNCTFVCFYLSQI